MNASKTFQIEVRNLTFSPSGESVCISILVHFLRTHMPRSPSFLQTMRARYDATVCVQRLTR